MKMFALCATLFLGGIIIAVVWSGRRERAYHDEIYRQCVADGKAAYYCDTLAWQAVQAKYR